MYMSHGGPIVAAPTIFSSPVQNLKEQKFSPYADNGGTVLAVAGKDFCIVAADTRMSEGYSIATRNYTKAIKLTSKCVLSTSGMQADAQTFHKNILARLEAYKHQNNKEMSTPAIAQMLSTMLYHKRFFPYYTFNELGGLDEEGVGAVYTYDAVGSFQRTLYGSSGSGQKLLQPILDNQIGKPHQIGASKDYFTVEQMGNLVKDAFNSASERDIHTGDHFDVFTITSGGIQHQRFDLKKD